MINKTDFLKKIIALIILIALLLMTLYSCSSDSKNDGDFSIVTSFYPVYLAVRNITEGTDVNLTNLTPNTAGCPHDYTLTPSNLKTLENADIFIANGAGMEDFTKDITSNISGLPIIYASENIKLTNNNPHVWTSINNYAIYIENITEELKKADPDNAEKYNENFQAYLTKLDTLNAQIEENLSEISSRDIVVFNEEFDYFADDYDLNIIASMSHDHDDAHVASEIEEVVEAITDNSCKALFAEPGYSNSAVDIVSNETNLEIYILDPVTTEIYKDNDAYLTAMLKNSQVLMEALK